MKKDEYIQEVISRIENKRAKQEVERELSAHIDDRISYYTDAGWDEETANEKAMEHMGDAQCVGTQMSKIHPSTNNFVIKKIMAYVMILIEAYVIITTLFLTCKSVEGGVYSIEPIDIEYFDCMSVDKKRFEKVKENPSDYLIAGYSFCLENYNLIPIVYIGQVFPSDPRIILESEHIECTADHYIDSADHMWYYFNVIVSKSDYEDGVLDDFGINILYYNGLLCVKRISIKSENIRDYEEVF